jgi:hypothetical protein
VRPARGQFQNLRQSLIKNFNLKVLKELDFPMGSMEKMLKKAGRKAGGTINSKIHSKLTPGREKGDKRLVRALRFQTPSLPASGGRRLMCRYGPALIRSALRRGSWTLG